MTPDDMRQDAELKIVELIKQKLADGTMTEERSQAIAQMVLTTLKPGMTFDAVYGAIFKLDDFYTELSPVVLPFIRDYDINIRKKAADAVGHLIKQGQYDAAEKLAHNAIKGTLNVVWQASAKPPGPEPPLLPPKENMRPPQGTTLTNSSQISSIPEVSPTTQPIQTLPQ